MKRLVLVVGGLFLLAESAFAIVDFQALYNFRMMRENQASSDEDRSRPALIGGKIAVHTNPLPIVPVALGLTFMPMSIWSEDDTAGFDTTKESEMLEVGVEMMAWLPMVPVVRPYMKVGFDFLGHKVEKDTVGDTEKKYNYMTLHGALGMKYALPMMPMLGLIAEATVGGMRFYPKPKDDADQPRIDELKETKIPYWGGSVGVEVAI